MLMMTSPKTLRKLATHRPTAQLGGVPAETDEGSITLALDHLRTLGRGRGARVELMRDRRRNRLVAEKVFGVGRGLSSRLVDTLYGLCFQAPFPYRTTASAVWAAYYRRKAIRLLTEYWFGEPCVADALYIRWDAALKAFILGTEYVAGRGPRLPPPDPDVLQRWLGKSVHSRPVAEMETLLSFMDRLRSHLHDSGFIGAQWQVERRTLVATANCLYDGQRWIVVDLESGVPALTIAQYLVQGLCIGRVPLFDDTDFRTLWSYLEQHAEALKQRLGEAKYLRLRDAAAKLEIHEQLWKTGEVALLRTPGRWVRAPDRAHIRRQTLERWRLEEQISAETARVLETSSLQFLGYWAFAGVLRRARHWARFLGNRAYRVAVMSPHVMAWVQAGRLDQHIGLRLLRHGRLMACGVWALVAMLPAALVRVCRDPQYRASVLRHAYHALVDERYQLALAAHCIARRIQEWESMQRLTTAEADRLQRAMVMPSAQEYVRGFGVHLALKALLPSVLLDPLFVAAAVATGSPYPLALIWVRSLAITVYTTVRWIKRPDLRFGTALAVGLVPKAGILAYPIQLSTVHPELSAFLMRDLASGLGQRLPVYGGHHTRTEHWCIRCADLPFALGSGIARLLPGRGMAPSAIHERSDDG
jgi:hypothetical protein